MCVRASQAVFVVKNLPVNTEDARAMGSVPGSGRSPGGGHGNPLQCSCRETPWAEGPCGLSEGSQRVGQN